MAVKKKADSMTVNSKTANDIKKGRKCLARVAKHTTNAMLAVITACVFTGCIRNRLLQVERIMESDIETADSLIYSINEPSGKRNRALYALLKTQIDYKMYRDAISDSTIRIASDHYGRKYKGYHSAMAWYSLGCISAELGNDSTAADAYLTAIRLFPDTLVRYYALAEQNLSYIFLDHRMDAEAIPLILSCRANAVRLKDSAAIAFCDYNIAKSLLYNNDYEDSRKMFLELKDSKWLSPNTRYEPLLQLSKIELYYDQDYNEALKYVDTYMIINNHRSHYGAAFTTKANILMSLNQIDSALYYYRLSLVDTDDPYTICNTYRYLSEIHSIKGNQDSATYYTKQVGEWADTLVSKSNSELILRALLNNSQLNPEPKSYPNVILRITIFPISIIIFSLLIIFTYKNKKDYRFIEEMYAKDDNISQEESKDPDIIAIESYSDEINKFKHSKLFETMVSATSTHVELSGKQKNEFNKDFRNTFLLLRAHLASSYKMNDDEIDFLIYSLLGFKQKDFYTLSFINHHRMVKYRLKDKIPVPLFDYIFKPELA